MGIGYNKEIITKDRRIMPSGPRDRQLKQARDAAASADQSGLINELRNQISNLTDKLVNSNSVGKYTDEQVNEEIVKAIKAETRDMAAKHEIEVAKLQGEIHILKEKISNLTDVIKNKDDIILQIRDNQVISTQSVLNTDAPTMEDVFIDPIEKESKVEKHIEIIPEVNKDNLDEKAKKLRSILGGKLPIGKI